MASSRNEHLRYRYGVCLNDGCSKCKSKEVQQIGARKELVCAECGKPLRECRRPLTWWEKNGKKVMGGSAAAIVLALGGLWAGGVFGGDEPTVPQDTIVVPKVDSLAQDNDSAAVDTIAKAEIEKENKDEKTKKGPQQDPGPNPEPRPEPNPGPRTGTLNLPYGKYVGEIRNGKPDGAGVLTYSKTQNVVGTKDVVAEPGERYEGVFENGKATFGVLYKNDGNTIKVKR